jgi:hypothetical protein
MCIGYTVEEYINEVCERLNDLDDKLTYVSNTKKIQSEINICLAYMLSYATGGIKSLNRKFLLKFASRIWKYFDESVFEISKPLNKMNKDELTYVINTMCWWTTGAY